MGTAPELGNVLSTCFQVFIVCIALQGYESHHKDGGRLDQDKDWPDSQPDASSQREGNSARQTDAECGEEVRR